MITYIGKTLYAVASSLNVQMKNEDDCVSDDITGLLYLHIFYYLCIDSLTYAFGWSAFLCRSRFVTPSL
jgi:hypothetical protein